MWEKVEPQSINFPIDVFQNNSEPNISCGLIDWVADVLVNAFAEQYLVKALHEPSMLYGHTPAKWLFTIIDVQPARDLHFFVLCTNKPLNATQPYSKFMHSNVL